MLALMFPYYSDVRLNAANLEYAFNINDAHHRPFLQTTTESIDCLYARHRHALT